MLPPAQVGEAELEDIVKIGLAGENAKALVGGGSDASGRLLSDYEGLENARMARTPRTAPQGSHLWHSIYFSISLTLFPIRGQYFERSAQPSEYDHGPDTPPRRGEYSFAF